MYLLRTYTLYQDCKERDIYIYFLTIVYYRLYAIYRVYGLQSASLHAAKGLALAKDISLDDDVFKSLAATAVLGEPPGAICSWEATEPGIV